MDELKELIEQLKKKVEELGGKSEYSLPSIKAEKIYADGEVYAITGQWIERTFTITFPYANEF